MIYLQFYLKGNSNIVRYGGGWLDRGWGSRVEREERGDVCMASRVLACEQTETVRLSVTGWTGAGHYE